MTKGMSRPMMIMLIGIAVLFGVVFLYKVTVGYLIGRAMKANETPVITVSAAKAVYQPWDSLLKATGSFTAVLGVDVTTELAGMVRAMHFNNGDTVKKNDLLVELNIDTETALLHQYQAQAKLAKITYTRDKAQRAVQAVSQQQVDNDLATLQVDEALIAQEESIIAKKRIRAPFSGRLGISPVDPGDYVNPGDKIVTLQSLDPIYVQFNVPQQNLPQIEVGQPISLTTNLFPDRTFEGKINAINPIVNTSTRNVLVEATLKNPEQKLLPGIFADVHITVAPPQKRLTLPLTAVTFNPYGQVVYIIKETGKDKKGRPILTVMQAFVKVGETRGDQVSIIEGVNEGDTVVTSGQMKLRNGSRVVINNTVEPSNNPAPQISNEQL